MSFTVEDGPKTYAKMASKSAAPFAAQASHQSAPAVTKPQPDIVKDTTPFSHVPQPQRVPPQRGRGGGRGAGRGGKWEKINTMLWTPQIEGNLLVV